MADINDQGTFDGTIISGGGGTIYTVALDDGRFVHVFFGPGVTMHTIEVHNGDRCQVMVGEGELSEVIRMLK